MMGHPAPTHIIIVINSVTESLERICTYICPSMCVCVCMCIYKYVCACVVRMCVPASESLILFCLFDFFSGYFAVAEKVFRIDAPTETHQVGRD